MANSSRLPWVGGVFGKAPAHSGKDFDKDCREMHVNKLENCSLECCNSKTFWVYFYLFSLQVCADGMKGLSSLDCFLSHLLSSLGV